MGIPSADSGASGCQVFSSQHNRDITETDATSPCTNLEKNLTHSGNGLGQAVGKEQTLEWVGGNRVAARQSPAPTPDLGGHSNEI